MPLTPAQHAAIHTRDRDLAVIAGAGSGKTFVLVSRFIALLDADPDLPLNAIAAITFTEKAAAEMRERVRSAIADRAAVPDADPRWLARLNALDSLRIGTIHSLCSALLRASAAEAQIDPAFGVLDEIAAALLARRAIDDALRDDPDESAAALLAAYPGRAVIRTLESLVGRETARLDDAQAVRAAWMTTWRTTAGRALTAFHAAYADMPFATLPTPPKDKLGEMIGMVRPTLESLAVLTQEWEALTDDQCAEVLTHYREARALMKITFGSAKTWDSPEALADARAAVTAVRERLDAVFRQVGDPPLTPHDDEAARLVVAWSRVAARATARYTALKAAQSALDFDDLEGRAARLLDQPEVRARFAGRAIRHVMVDEFQDTNVRQWQIARALTQGTAGALFVVGDPKQSIYGFRGADVRVFRDVVGAIGGEPIALAQSFRTHQPLVEQFNALFAALLTETDENAYAVGFGEAMIAERPAPSDAPPITLLLTVRAEADDDDEDDDPPEARESEAHAIAGHIAGLIAEGRPVYDRAAGDVRQVGYGDVAVLFQSMGHVGLYEDALARAGIPYVTVAGRGFYDRQEVWDMLNLLRALYAPADDLALASALRSPLFAVSDEGLLRLRQHQPRAGAGWLWAALTDEAFPRADGAPADAEAIAFARDALMRLRADTGRVPIGDLLRAACDATGWLALLEALPGGTRLRANAEKLIAIADERAGFALGAFLEQIDALRAAEAREGEALLDAQGAVRLMTVHKSKGLEFPVVVLADCGYVRNRKDEAKAVYDPDGGWACRVYAPDEAEEVAPWAMRIARQRDADQRDAEKRRLLYVAATRAADLLVCSSGISRNTKGALKLRPHSWLSWLWSALELGGNEMGSAVIDTPIGAVAVSVLPAPEIAPSDGGQADPFADALAALTAADADPPRLMASVAAPPREAREFAATQLADLGAALEALPADRRAWFQARWQRGLTGEAGDDLPSVVASGTRARARLIGDIVHRALQYGLDEESCDLPRLLRDAAWEAGVLNPDEAAAIAEAAAVRVRAAHSSPVYAALRAAEAAGRRVLREVPFSLQTGGGRRIHGVIDLLIEREDGSWLLIDFKTAALGNASPQAVAQHARRYFVQVGIYARAVEQLTGHAPECALYYIDPDVIVTVDEAAWRTALTHVPGGVR
jgi:ATP-dependent helicase/nuclease subunit A